MEIITFNAGQNKFTAHVWSIYHEIWNEYDELMGVVEWHDSFVQYDANYRAKKDGWTDQTVNLDNQRDDETLEEWQSRHLSALFTKVLA